ncbi:methyl-accepting chemotaxis protein [Paraburkholderia tagetis]|uniref:methyl-accepting chemotaxis protein n=1 Tax=Paraburkholderia tagetis TaxID=2913261 RepID=UPI002367D32E|nr:methyl-accepting chemotaxis protein [Paraburkholderia tagetis]
MQWLGALTVGKRLALLILVAATGLLSITATGLLQMDHVHDTAGFAQVNVVPSLMALDNVQASFIRMRAKTYESLLTSDPSKRSGMQQAVKEGRAGVDAHLKEYEPLLADQQDRELLSADRARLAEFDAALERLTASSLNSSGSQIDGEALQNFMDAAKRANDALMEHRAYNVKLGEAGAAQAQATITSARVSLMMISGATLVIVVLLGTWITRTLLRQLGTEPSHLADVATHIARGDLTEQITARENDRSSVLFAVKTMRDGLVDIVLRIQTATDAIATGSGEIASGNQDLSSRTEEQAASLEETAASMEELTTTVKQNAENAQQARALAANASEVAGKGSEVVQKVVVTMNDISDSSSKIADITGIIEGIAFQTNILALNAAVEAARAGEQGRGFAVVASEVRSLAQRSSSAAKEIKELIATSVEKIQGGSVLASEAGKTMADVTQAVSRVTDIMGEIAAASIEQSRGIEQVNQAITQMDEVTQQNAALVEEAAAASHSLQEQGSRLTEAAAYFRIDQRRASVVPPVLPADGQAVRAADRLAVIG